MNRCPEYVVTRECVITINGTCCSFGAGLNDFDEGHWRGGLKIEIFLGPEMATSEASAIWP